MTTNRTKQLNIRQAAVPFLFLTILLLTVLGVISSWLTIVREMEAQQRDNLEYHKTAFHDEIERQFSVLDGYSASFTQEQLADHNTLLEKLNRCVDNTEFSLVCFAYPDGTLFRQDNASAQVSHRYYFQQAMQGTKVVEFLSNSAIDPTPRVGMAVPVILDGQVQGVLLGLYDQENFRTLFERSFSSDNLIYLCHANGKLILGTEAAETLLSNSGLRVEGSSLTDILSQADFVRGSKQQMETDLLNSQPGQAAYRHNGALRYTAYTPLGINNWQIVSVLLESQMHESALGIAGPLFAITILACLAILAVLIYLLIQAHRLAFQEQLKSIEIRYQAEHDDLTGVLVEKAFLKHLEQRLKTPLSEEHCLVYLDIYKFKLINEMFGYAKGNELLCAQAKLLDQLTQRYEGLCARIAGDQFVLFLPHREEIIQSFHSREYHPRQVVPLDLYLHYGIYVIHNQEIPADQMVDCARMAQKTVKGNYDNCISYYTEEMRQRAIKEQEIITSMTSALENGEFVVYLQPQYNYQTNTICGSEALVRWNSPTKGLIPPGDFIPIFESNGFINRLDEYVWEQVCILQRTWLDQGRQILPISVNVSRADLLQGGIAQKLTNLIQTYRLNPSALCVEITESAYMDNPQLLISEINALAESGFTVEMDDFGSGYSSLNMLKDVPFHVLKTDLKFLSATGIPSRKDRILDNIIRMAHEIGMQVIAEGVETKEQADDLMRLNCARMQGYYFSRPLPVPEFEKLIF